MDARLEGFNCAQSVLLAFADIIPLDRQSLLSLSAPLGAGLACGEICGVANALAIASGLMMKADFPEAKGDAMKRARQLIETFRTRNGALRCADLKGVPGKPSCNELILQGVEILHRDLNK